MHRIFGKAKPAAPAPPPPDLGAHVSKMQGRVPDLDRKIAEIDGQLLKIKQQLQVTRAPGQQNSLKQNALLLLKRKKMYEQQRGSVQQQIFNMDQVAFTMDTISTAKEQVVVMQHMKAEMSRATGELNIDDVADLQEDMTDLLADAEEINEVLSRDYSVGMDVNEADLMGELEGLDAELSGIPDAPAASGVAADPLAGLSDLSGAAAPVSAGGAAGGAAAVPPWLMPMPPTAAPAAAAAAAVAPQPVAAGSAR